MTDVMRGGLCKKGELAESVFELRDGRNFVSVYIVGTLYLLGHGLARVFPPVNCYYH